MKTQGENDVGVQNRSPQDVPLWYADFSELKVTLELRKSSGKKKGNFSCRLKKNFCPSLTYLELELGASPLIRDYKV